MPKHRLTTSTNARTDIGDDGTEYVNADDVMELARQEEPRWNPLFERLAGQ